MRAHVPRVWIHTSAPNFSLISSLFGVKILVNLWLVGRAATVLQRQETYYQKFEPPRRFKVNGFECPLEKSPFALALFVLSSRMFPLYGDQPGHMYSIVFVLVCMLFALPEAP